jgi:hypothetical protein
MGSEAHPMRTTLGTLAAIVLFAAAGFAAEIKSTTRITASSPAARQPIEITDRSVLLLSNVFAGSFIGAPADAPDSTLTRYTISFDVQWPGEVKAEAYVVQYCVDKATGQGYVYLPGRGDPSHARNISTILRTGQDGKWHRASAEWSAAIGRYLR